MPILYELEISDRDIDQLLDIDGKLDAGKFVGIVPEEVVDAIDDIVDIYDRTSWGIFGHIFHHQRPSLAWAYILLDREYAVADVVRETLCDDSGIKFGHYSVLCNPRFLNDQHSIGYIWIEDKSSLAKVANTSALAFPATNIPEDVSQLIRAIRPAPWGKEKVEEIDMSRDFYWVDDDPDDASVAALAAAGQSSRLIIASTDQWLDDLGRIRKLLERAIRNNSG
jgi:hypothetical protein